MNHPLSGNKLKCSIEINHKHGGLTNKSIGIFTIGPVQSFISSAKKTKDFWAGSYLLSYLTWTALKVVIEESNENSVVFPAIDGQPLYKLSFENKKNEEELKLPTLPNRFMVLLDKDKSLDILKKCEKAVNNELNNIIDFIIEEENIKSDKSEIIKQIDKLLEIYWISIPFEQDLGSEIGRHYERNSQYSALTSLSEELLGSRKNLRNFEQQIEKGHKCHICGERVGRVEDEYIDKKSKNNPKKLCGVCLLKRHFDKYFTKKVLEKETKKEIYYPSVVEVAIMDYKKKIVENANENTIKKIVEFVNGDRELRKEAYDKGIANWFIKKFSLNLDNESPQREFLGIDGGYLDINGDKLKDKDDSLKYEFVDLLNELKKVKDKNGNSIKFNKYYALIYLDGDSMGKWVSGELIEDAKKNGMSPEMHYLVSKSLTNYTKHVKKIFEKRKGVIVYAGGDDVAAFVNLEDLFDVMRELRAHFSGSVNEKGEIDYENDGIIRGKEDTITLGKNASASMGVCIAHYKKPLRLVIKKAKEMEALSKKHKATINGKEKEKDAFAIAVLKNSGEIRTASLKWRYSIESDNYIDTIESCVKPILKMFEDEKLSRGYAYALKEELSLISNTGNDELIKSEVKRISKRKIIENDKSERKKHIAELNTVITNLYDSCNMDEGAPSEKLDNFISILEIVSFIGRRGD